jgi:SRSO17 transposase
MASLAEFDRYMAHLCEGLGHADRHQSLLDYCSGLMLPIERKSVEPLAAHAAPDNVPAKHQSLHHFVANSGWSDGVLLERVRAWVEPHLGIEGGAYWIIDDTGHPKCGSHSVGVARQYCGKLGKRDNCQVAVSLSLASAEGSVPLDYELYVPKDWMKDAKRRRAAGIPQTLQFATKQQMALAQIRRAHARGVVPGIVLADVDYGRDTSLREGVAALGLRYAVAVRSDMTVWPPATGPLSPASYSGRGPVPKRLRRAAGHTPTRLKRFAEQLKPSAWRTVTWREGSNAKLCSRFARARVRVAYQDYLRTTPREEEWLLIEWPVGEAEPTRYFVSNLPADTPLRTLVNTVKMRWRIEHDYHELKQEFGLSHYEGRGWRGFHHHASLCIAAYGFLTADRLKQRSKKNSTQSKASLLPETYQPRGSRPRAAPCPGFDSDATLCHRYANRAAS